MSTYEKKADEKRHVLFEHRPAIDTKAHFHSAVELLFVEKGEIEITIDGQTRTLQANDACFCDSFCVHAYPANSDSLVYVVVGEKTFFERFFTQNKGLVPEKFFRFSDFAFLSQLYKLYKEATVYKPSVFEGILQILLSKIAETNVFVMRQTNKQSSLVCEILHYAENHLDEELSLLQIAKRFGYSGEHLSRLLHKHLCENWKNYVSRLRIKRAVELLQSSPKTSVAEIAFSCGFESLNTFYRAYKRECGKSPKK
ncbi:MAG: AraC family transcriptional regulator [Clostridia bacterium]|nr:AraC family transcriptional regulator [Clostridia bacterium]